MKEQAKQACDEFIEYMTNPKCSFKMQVTDDAMLQALAKIWSDHW